MKRFYILLVVLALAAAACELPAPPSTVATDASAVPSATATLTQAPALTPTESATPSVPTATSATSTCISDNSVTNFPERELLVVNGVSVGLQVRDANCPRATYHDETGVAKGQQYRVDAPKGWSIAFAAVSCAVAEDGHDQVEYTNTPFILIQGPWHGSLGCYEAGVHGLPSEWESYLTTVIKPLHDSEVGHVVPLTILGGE